jgi:hypothetical protein
MCEVIEESNDLHTLGQDFMSINPLEEMDIGDGSIPRLTFVKQNLKVHYKVKLIESLKKYVDCLVLNYHEMPGLSSELVEH